MNQAKINELYELAHVVHEIPYEGSVVDPTIVSVHKQRVFDRNLFAELIVRECSSMIESQDVDPAFKFRMSRAFKKSFGITE